MRCALTSAVFLAASTLVLSIMPAHAADMPALSPGMEGGGESTGRSATPGVPALFRAAAHGGQPVPLTPPTAGAPADETGAVVFIPARGTADVLTESLAELPAVAGLPDRVVEACRLRIETAAEGLGAVRVEARGAGSARRLSDGGYIAPALVRVVYPQGGGYQVRQAYTDCHFNKAGEVVATLAGGTQQVQAAAPRTAGHRAQIVASARAGRAAGRTVAARSNSAGQARREQRLIAMRDATARRIASAKSPAPGVRSAALVREKAWTRLAPGARAYTLATTGARVHARYRAPEPSNRPLSLLPPSATAPRASSQRERRERP